MSAVEILERLLNGAGESVGLVVSEPGYKKDPLLEMLREDFDEARDALTRARLTGEIS